MIENKNQYDEIIRQLKNTPGSEKVLAAFLKYTKIINLAPKNVQIYLAENRPSYVGYSEDAQCITLVVKFAVLDNDGNKTFDFALECYHQVSRHNSNTTRFFDSYSWWLILQSRIRDGVAEHNLPRARWYRKSSIANIKILLGL